MNISAAHREHLFQVLISLAILGFFVVWIEWDTNGIHAWLYEDGPIEWLQAINYGLASLGFFIVAFRSTYLRDKTQGPRYLMVIAWALLMFFFMGEEISWGQRIFGIETPEGLSEINKQRELNLHNIEIVDSFLGGKYRYLSIIMITTGLLLPLLAASATGRRWIQWWGFPVTPPGYGILFVGAYLYGKYYHGIAVTAQDADEVRECLMSFGMLLFAWHGAIKPCALFRACARDSSTA